MPPLRERGEDILSIAEYFLKNHTSEEKKNFQGFDEDVRSIFMNYEWPGNVRQLQNVVRNIVVLNDAEVVSQNILPAPLNQIDPNKQVIRPPITQQDAPNVSYAPVNQDVMPPVTQDSPGTSFLGDTPDTLVRMEELERLAIENAIAVCDGSIPEVAHYLGISAATIYRKKAAWQKEKEAS